LVSSLERVQYSHYIVGLINTICTNIKPDKCIFSPTCSSRSGCGRQEHIGSLDGDNNHV
jgi:putative component of membrane protein insertase Oxa1/YidC/SpoIIIJ protein YidD